MSRMRVERPSGGVSAVFLPRFRSATLRRPPAVDPGVNALHASPRAGDAALVAVLGLAGIASAVLLGLGLAALSRRQSKPYLLVALALATLAARTTVAVMTMLGVLPDGTHHLSEHTLDVAMAGLVIGAVYYARTSVPDVAEEEL